MAPRKSRTEQLGLYDVEFESQALTDSLLRREYLQKAVDEHAALDEAIGKLLQTEFPDPGPGKKIVRITGTNSKTRMPVHWHITYDVKQPAESRTWKVTDLELEAADDPAP